MSEQPGHDPSQPSEEELRAALEEQLRRLRVDDVLLQTVVTLVNLAGRKLTVDGERDPAQARQAIDAVRALLPLCPQEELGPIRDALSQLQMLYAREARPEDADQPPATGEAAASADEAERAKARSKIWTPPGT
jgi:hypothetical protein